MNRDYLSENDVPTQRVRCPVHGFIRYSKNERKLIDHEVFQRLRHIRQLAMEYLVYPGAMHTRFEHSLGVMEMATQMFDTLERQHREQIQDDLKQVPELREQTMPKARQLVRLLGLLHDVGHPAYAHAGEKGIPGQDHEKVSIYVIQNVLSALIDSIFFQGASGLLVRLMEKSPELAFLGQLVAGELDADRADYLLRDSLHCGVAYGLYDSAKLIESLTLIKHADTGRLQLALHRGGEHAFEAMILARYQMNTQVYLHKIRRLYDHYLEEYMKLWGPEYYKDLGDVLKHDDMSVMQEIRKDAAQVGPRQIWARRIVDRRHHRVVYETGDNADQPKLQKAKRILKELQKHYENTDFFLDDSPVPIYKLSIPGDQEEQQVEDLYIQQRNGGRTLLAHESAIISKIPKRVRTVRIFAEAEGNLLKAIRSDAANLERNV
ncbi:MAG: HD domain-containing protein [Acidobacteriia bacterium]|nr:HD domain-containing protein [Terriglobia bacterium]